MLTIAAVLTGLAAAFLASAQVPPGTFHPARHPELCMDVAGAVFQAGTPVQLWKCNGTPAQAWVFEHSYRQFRDLRVNGTDMCMNFVGGGHKGRKMTLIKCGTENAARNWWFSSDYGEPRYGMIKKLDGATHSWALDVTDGGMFSGNQLQIWEPYEDNDNQQWLWKYI